MRAPHCPFILSCCGYCTRYLWITKKRGRGIFFLSFPLRRVAIRSVSTTDAGRFGRFWRSPSSSTGSSRAGNFVYGQISSRTPDPVSPRPYLRIDAAGLNSIPALSLGSAVENIRPGTSGKRVCDCFWQIRDSVPRIASHRASRSSLFPSPRPAQTFQERNKAVTRHLTNTAALQNRPCSPSLIIWNAGEQLGSSQHSIKSSHLRSLIQMKHRDLRTLNFQAGRISARSQSFNWLIIKQESWLQLGYRDVGFDIFGIHTDSHT